MQVNMVAVIDNRIIDSMVLSISEKDVRKNFIETGANAFYLDKDKILCHIFPILYHYHNLNNRPYNKYLARKKEILMKYVFNACSKIDDLSTAKVFDIIEPIEKDLNFMKNIDKQDMFNYISDCEEIQNWLSFISRNKGNDLYIYIYE